MRSWLTFLSVWAISAQTGWLAYPPLSGIEYSPGVGVDYWIWSLQLSGINTTLTGSTFRYHPEDARTGHDHVQDASIYLGITVANVLIIASFPIRRSPVALLTLDRYLGTHFFTNDMGGNMMMYINLIWAGGDPRKFTS
ncbi:cbb3-type cytochrome c oxidase subunit I [Escherichia coli]